VRVHQINYRCRREIIGYTQDPEKWIGFIEYSGRRERMPLRVTEKPEMNATRLEASDPLPFDKLEKHLL
jgi:hypothetical protein